MYSSAVSSVIWGVLSTTAMIVGNVKTINVRTFGLERIMVYPAYKLNTKNNVFNQNEMSIVLCRFMYLQTKTIK